MRIKNGYLIVDEDIGRCTQCNTVADLRPYGLNEGAICVKCGSKDPQTPARMKKHMAIMLKHAPNGVIFQDPNQRN